MVEGAIFLTALTSVSKSSGFDPQKATPGSLALINIAIDVLTVDISRPAETELDPCPMRSISSAGRAARGARISKRSWAADG